MTLPNGTAQTSLVSKMTTTVTVLTMKNVSHQPDQDNDKAVSFMNLLIVEDNAKMRGMIRNVVEDLVENISECKDGDEALAAYSANRPDWVLMDIQMENVNGIAATSKIMAEFADAKIVIVTNFDDPDFRDSARRAGACNYVLKENLFDIRRILMGEDPPAELGEANMN